MREKIKQFMEQKEVKTIPTENQTPLSGRINPPLHGSLAGILLTAYHVMIFSGVPTMRPRQAIRLAATRHVLPCFAVLGL